LSAEGSDRPARTVSETLFEEYLAASRLPFEFEPEIVGSRQRPDYRVTSNQMSVLVEVKEFLATGDRPAPGFSAFDPYTPLREKINAAARKFRALKTHTCALLLHNVDRPLIRVDWPQAVMGAMLGDVGFQIRVDTRNGLASDDPRPVFLGRGKMRDYKSNRPQNTTISAILVLEVFQLGVKQLPIAEARLVAEKMRPLTEDEFVSLAGQSVETVLRIKVHENPFARIRFPRELFAGPYDEHWTWDADGYLQRSYVGPDFASLENARSGLGLRPS
jgi:hypothetical protein